MLKGLFSLGVGRGSSAGPQITTIPVQELLSRRSHYKQLLILSEIGGKTPHEIAARFDSPPGTTPADVAADLARLQQTLETVDLPDPLAEEFDEVYGTRRHLQFMEGVTLTDEPSVSGRPEAQQQRIDAYVERSLDADRSVGYPTDTLSEWFYRRLH